MTKTLQIELQARDYLGFKELIFKEIGIDLGDHKHSLVQTRLFKRIVHHRLESYEAYLHMVKQDKVERNEMMNLITTNETYFFRETSHFDFLQKELESSRERKYRIWSAASSSGAEAYSIAMVCDNVVGRGRWEVVGTDINSEVVKTAEVGIYPEKWVEKVPMHFRKKYCLKGRGSHEGQFLVDRELAKSMTFSENNLMLENPSLGKFQMVFLRNVLIYFNTQTKKKVVENVMKNLSIGGYLIISLTESLQNIEIKNLKQIHPSIYQKIG